MAVYKFVAAAVFMLMMVGLVNAAGSIVQIADAQTDRPGATISIFDRPFIYYWDDVATEIVEMRWNSTHNNLSVFQSYTPNSLRPHVRAVNVSNQYWFGTGTNGLFPNNTYYNSVYDLAAGTINVTTVYNNYWSTGTFDSINFNGTAFISGRETNQYNGENGGSPNDRELNGFNFWNHGEGKWEDVVFTGYHSHQGMDLVVFNSKLRYTWQINDTTFLVYDFDTTDYKNPTNNITIVLYNRTDYPTLIEDGPSFSPTTAVHPRGTDHVIFYRDNGLPGSLGNTYGLWALRNTSTGYSYRTQVHNWTGSSIYDSEMNQDAYFSCIGTNLTQYWCYVPLLNATVSEVTNPGGPNYLMKVRLDENLTFIDDYLIDTATSAAPVISQIQPKAKPRQWNNTIYFAYTDVSTWGTDMEQFIWIEETNSTLGGTAAPAGPDAIAPSVTIQTPTNSTFTQLSDNFTLAYIASDETAISSCAYHLNGTSNTTLSDCRNTTFKITEGTHEVFVWVDDGTNTNFTSVAFSWNNDSASW